MAISGAFIPAFGLNNMPGSIPLLGALFGGRNEGLFGITYRLFGPLDEPQLTMNPISALAPGIFRKISSSVSEASARHDERVLLAARARASPRRRH